MIRPLPLESRTSRRRFLQTGAVLALAPRLPRACLSAGDPAPGAAARTSTAPKSAQCRVAIVACKQYGPAVKPALKRSFDLLGGIGRLVRGKTVTVKLNLTGTNFSAAFGRPVGESYMTHFDTALALCALLFENGARRVRLVESTNSRAPLETSLGFAGWDLGALQSQGQVEFENTRNLGAGARYATLPVPDGGRFFSALELNHSYADTDVMVSLCKLKTHVTTGVTLSMKNMFGVTPNSLYGDEAGSEEATKGRGVLHGGGRAERAVAALPHLRANPPRDAGARVPRIITDIVAARPMHLAIIDGISTLDGGEGPWAASPQSRLVTPGVLIVGLNPVATDAVGTAVMGFDNPRAAHRTAPFTHCENHMLLAEQAGLGPANLAQIDVVGEPIAAVRTPFNAPFRG